MILALETGWTPRVIARLSAPFRAACHWALYARAIVGDDGLTDVEIPPGSNASQRLAIGKLRADIGKLRDILYPEDADG